MSKPRFKPLLLLFSCLVLFLVLTLVAILYFSPVATSEEATSPDGRYHVEASTIGGKPPHIEIAITDTATRQVIWKLERHLLPGETLPDFGDRSRRFIKFAPDSKSVTIPLASPPDITIPLR